MCVCVHVNCSVLKLFSFYVNSLSHNLQSFKPNSLILVNVFLLTSSAVELNLASPIPLASAICLSLPCRIVHASASVFMTAVSFHFVYSHLFLQLSPCLYHLLPSTGTAIMLVISSFEGHNIFHAMFLFTKMFINLDRSGVQAREHVANNGLNQKCIYLPQMQHVSN